ncbi:MAG: glycoside hydrolase [Synergistaceae bacterium]|jgi:spore germination protein YaaH|nr:glycoside hydrolase [Synergistaceae bacterium]
MKKRAPRVWHVRFAAAAAALLLAAFMAGMAYAGDTVPDDPFSRYVRIGRMVSPGAVNMTPHAAIIREHADSAIPPDVWVPGELLTQMNVPVKLSPEKTSYSIRVDKPAETFGLPALASLAPDAADLYFRAKSEDSKLYFNLTGMENITGLAYAFAPGDVLTVGALRHMSPYIAPYRKQPVPEKLTGRFNLVWDHVMNDNADLTTEAPLTAVSVISPTWFVLLDETGRVGNRADVSYVESAHAQGIQVWALVSNGFNKARTGKFLADQKAQDAFIASMLAYAKIYGFDGINIDFESVDNKDAKPLTDFVRRFAASGREQGLLFSMDVTVPSRWSLCYERKQLSQIVDYIAVMTYDEHWRTSPRAGSTASLPWVRAAIENTLAEVPSGKLLMGVPFYTREWRETKGKNGKTSVKSRTFSMASSDHKIATTGAQKKWLEAAGQNYIEYTGDGDKFRVWIEDAESIALRMGLLDKYGLAGAAFWRKGFETPDIWKVIEDASK